MAGPPRAAARRTPERTCIACRQPAGKRELIRLVRTRDGHVMRDPSGKAAGRGAYVHPSRTCWEKALKSGSMKGAFKIIPDPDDVEALRAFGKTLPAEESEAS
jgi:predicted RNA-binding protein YlxR (DUF448 family)